MSEKWKPEKGEKFWFINYTGDIHSTTYYGDGIDTKFIAFGNMFKTEEEAKTAVEKIKALLLSLQEPKKDCNKLPKLTAEVFDRPDCPAWAKYAAVSKFGCLTFFEEKPVLGNNSFLPLSENYTTKLYRNEPGRWDSSDWQNSRIERPEKKQDCSDSEWCKVGEWVYSPCCCNPDKGTYFKVTQIDDVCIFGEDYVCHVDNAVRARLRPYNAEEMKALVGKVIENFKYVLWCDGYEKESNRVVTLLKAFTAEDLIKEDYTVDREPCYKLEHLNDKGEWVE